jgi:hypothetical protein
MTAYQRKKFWSQITLALCFAGYLLFWMFESLNQERLQKIDQLGIRYGFGVQTQDAAEIAFFQIVVPDNVTDTEATQGERWIDVSAVP